MKYISVLIVIMALGCSVPSTMVTGSWTSPNEKKAYKKILVASFTSNTVARARIEEDLVMQLRGKGIPAEKSIDKFPPDMSQSDTDRTVMMDRIKNADVDAILAVTILKMESDTRYVPGSNTYNPYGNTYYRNFWGYYTYRYPYAYDPGYYTTDFTYFVETNLYDAATEDLIWSAQSETYNPANLQTFSGDFARTIVSEMQKDGVISALSMK